MRALSVISKIFMWVTLVVYLFFQAMALFGIVGNNQDLIEANQPDKVYNVIPLIIATALMLAGVIVFAAVRKKRYIGLIIGAVAAIIMLMVALDLGRAFPVYVGSSGADTGLSTAKLIWRHIGIAAVPVFMLIAWLSGHFADKAAALANKDKHGFDLSGGAIFKDLGEGSNEEAEPRRMKRSIRKRMEKDNQ